MATDKDDTETNGGAAHSTLTNGSVAHLANGVAKKSKGQERKERKKKKKAEKGTSQDPAPAATTHASESEELDDDIVVEYVSAPLDLGDEEPVKEEEATDMDAEYGGAGLGLGFGGGGGLGFGAPGFVSAGATVSKPKDAFEEFKRIFEKFAKAEELTKPATDDDDAPVEADKEQDEQPKKPAAENSDSDDDDEGDNEKKTSKKKRKLENRLKIAALKQLCARPEVVEVWDVTAGDPALLVFLKAYKNTVPVPRHWSQKRKYLQGKRGIEKPAFKLPDFIEATGISEMRQAYQEKEEAKKVKQKQRERMQPKMGRMDIDYQVLHDAFFKYQTKPKLTDMGELYYEGKEFEARVDHLKPGVLSDELRKSLGMVDGAPPPWLINMQRYGPPPSYPQLKVAGLNAPIPPGASFGYHPGGWGKPPVDEDGNPLYGDVFGQYGGDDDSDEEVDKAARWGDLESDAEEESEEEEEEKEEGPTDEQIAEGIASGIMSGLMSNASGIASGISSSLPSGIETPDSTTINLRKATDEAAAGRPLYQVLEQRQVPIAPGSLMGGDHVYVLPGDKGAKVGDKRTRLGNLPGGLAPSDVEVTLNPEELEGLDPQAIKQLWEEKQAALREQTRPEDFSDMVAQNAAKQKHKIAKKADAKAQKRSKTDEKDYKF